MPNISKVMFKAMYIYSPTTKLSFGTTWRYESKTSPTGLFTSVDSWPGNNGVVDSHHIFDETVTYRFSSSSTLRLTLKNIFYSEVRNSSYYYNH